LLLLHHACFLDCLLLARFSWEIHISVSCSTLYSFILPLHRGIEDIIHLGQDL
jgi:hypothetical protein